MATICNNISESMFYVYAYIRARDLTPYYIGKGKNNRAYEISGRATKPPKNKKLIIIIENNLTELGALALERRLIRWYGRKDTIYIDRPPGILMNRTDGGDGTSGLVHTAAHRQKNSEQGKLRPKPSAKTRAKLRQAGLGKHFTNERKEKIRLSKFGSKWWNNGVENKQSHDCPGQDWVVGRVISEKHLNAIQKSNKTRIISDDTRHKNSVSQSKLVWWNNGITSTKAASQPGPEWTRGVIIKNSLKGKLKSDSTREKMKLSWAARRAKIV